MASDPGLKFLPKNLRESLMPFQREGIQYALERNGRCLFGDEMGLGKTIQAISVAYYYKSEWPLLIVVPSSMRYPWIEELERWLPDLQPSDVNLITSSTDVRNICRCKISLVGYGLLRNESKTLIQSLMDQAFQIVIVDESHYMKNKKAARTKLLVPLLHKAKRVILLTGTPALARPAELFTQIDSIQKGLVGTWSDFTKRYCDAHFKYFGRQRMWDTSGASNLDELHKLLVKTVMIRREKKQVLTQLPPKRRQKVPFELADSDSKKQLEKCWNELTKVISSLSNPEEELRNASFEVRKLATQMYNLTGKAKIGAVCEYIKTLLENQGLKFLVFAHHKEVLTALAQTVAAFAKEHKAPIKYIRIDGDVPSLERMHLVKQFQTDDNTRVAVLSILAAGTGLTLTAASQVVFAELHWTPGILEQCEDRAHRIGQVNAIHVHYLVARGTIDEWLWSALSKKVNVLSSTLNGRVQHLQMESKNAEEVEFLKHAAAWLPSNRDLQDDKSFFFGSKNQSQDIRRFFTPGHHVEGTKKKKRKHSSLSVPAETPPNPHRVSSTDASSTSMIYISDDDDDFRATKKLRHCKDLSPKELFSEEGDTSVLACSTPDEGVQDSDVDSRSVEDTPTRRDAGILSECFIADDLPAMKSNKKRRCSSKEKMGIATESPLISRPRTFDEGDSEISQDMNTPAIPQSRKKDDTHSTTHKTSKRLQIDSPCTPKSFRHQSEGLMSSSTEVVDIVWKCCACTFENHPDLPFCEICSTPRKTTRRQVPKTRTGTPRDGTVSGPSKKQSPGLSHDADSQDASRSKDKSSSQSSRNFTSEPTPSGSLKGTKMDQAGQSSYLHPTPLNGDEAKAAQTADEEDDMLSSCESTEILSRTDNPSDYVILSDSATHEDLEHKSTEFQTSVSEPNLLGETEEATDDSLTEESTSEQNEWTCVDPYCCYPNKTYNSECEVCLSPRPTCQVSSTSRPSGFITASRVHQSNPSKDSKPELLEEAPPEETASTLEQTDTTDDVVHHESFLYFPSRHTDRIYLYDQDGNALDCSFLAIDLQHRDLDALPEVLHNQHSMSIAMRFLREWNSLNEVKRKQLRKMGDMFDSPIQALEAMKKGQPYQLCTKRHITKNDLADAARQKAESLGGRVRVISKTRSTNPITKQRSHQKMSDDENKPAAVPSCSGSISLPSQSNPVSCEAGRGTSPKLKKGSYVQAVDGEGRPLCVFCGKVASVSASETRHSDEAWDTRYCSEACKDNHQLRWGSSKYVRDQLLEAEHGVCQLCGLEAQQLFSNIKDAAKAERKEILQHSAFSKMSTHRLNEIIRNPSSGQFWHADHIVAVMEGGGLCSLDNYRTLCVLCHDKVTAQQNSRRRNKIKSAGIPDIRSFFNS